MNSNYKIRNVCPACCGENINMLGSTRDRHYKIPGVWSYGACNGCGLIRLNPMPTSQYLMTLYPSEFYAHKKNVNTYLNFKEVMRRTLFRTNLFKDPSFNGPGRILDYGCGTGWSLVKFKELNWDCIGIEPSITAAKTGNEYYNLNIIPGTIHTIHTISINLDNFDYIRSNHSLEHDPDIRETLSKLIKLLNHGAKIAIGVPNADSLAFKIFGKYWWYFGAPVHTYCLTKNHLKAILEEFGLKILSVRYTGNFAGLLGSFQIFMNRNNPDKSSTEGFFYNSPLLIFIAQICAIILNFCKQGDSIEIVAERV